MKLVRNKTRKPLKVHLAGGHVLHLGPSQTGRVSNHELERQAFRRLLERGEIEVLEPGAAGTSPRGPRVVHESTAGYPQPKVVLPSGNRSGDASGRR